MWVRLSIVAASLGALAGLASCQSDPKQHGGSQTESGGERAPKGAHDDESPADGDPADREGLATLATQASLLVELDTAVGRTEFFAGNPPPLRAGMLRAALAWVAHNPDLSDEARGHHLARIYGLAAPLRLARPVVSALAEALAETERGPALTAAASALAIHEDPVAERGPRHGGPPRGGPPPDGAHRSPSRRPGGITHPNAFGELEARLDNAPRSAVGAPELPALTPRERIARVGQADGPNADGPNADGPNADGPNADGPNAGGPKADAPKATDAEPRSGDAAPHELDPAGERVAGMQGRRPIFRHDGASPDRRPAEIPVDWLDEAVEISAEPSVVLDHYVLTDTSGFALEVPTTWPAIRIGEPGMRRMPVMAELLVPPARPEAGVQRFLRLTVSAGWHTGPDESAGRAERAPLDAGVGARAPRARDDEAGPPVDAPAIDPFDALAEAHCGERAIELGPAARPEQLAATFGPDARTGWSESRSCALVVWSSSAGVARAVAGHGFADLSAFLASVSVVLATREAAP